MEPLKPTIVLVHGAWADSSSWALVIKRLRASGYPLHAIANPLQGLVGETPYLSSYLATIEGPVVLVGQSYGGALITNVDASAFDIRSLVYVAGFIPIKGQTVAIDQGGDAGSEVVHGVTSGLVPGSARRRGARCSRAARSCARPRWMRLRTVPSLMPSVAAISS
jgi:pimeloyl-ACP methyl ester carboxylesterase